MSAPPLTRPEGLVGRVTGRVAPDTIGEVLVEIRGGKEAFYAKPFADEVIEEGDEALVVIYQPPRTVLVTTWGH